MIIKNITSYLSLVLITLFLSCNNHKISSNLSVINGIVNPSFAKNKYIYLYSYTDSLSLFFGEKNLIDSCEISEKGEYKFTLKNINSPTLFDLGIQGNIFARNYLIYPSEEIQLDFEGIEIPVQLKSYNNIGKYNEFVQIFNDSFFRDSIVKKEYFNNSNYLLAPEYAKYAEARKSKQLAFFNQYFKDKNIDSTFKFYFQTETEFNWANDKIYFLWKKRTRQEWVQLDTNYFDFLTQINQDNPKSLICPGYVRYINLFLTELYQEQVFNLAPGYPQSLHKSYSAVKFYTGIGRKIAFHNLLRDETSGINSNPPENSNQAKLVEKMKQIAFQNTLDSSFFEY